MSIADPSNLLLDLLTSPVTRAELDDQTERVAAQRRLLSEASHCLAAWAGLLAQLNGVRVAYPDVPIPPAFAALAETLRWER